MLERGIYDINKFLERSKIVSEKITAEKRKKENIINIISSTKNKSENKNVLIPNIEKIVKIYDSIESVEEKNNLLKKVIDKIIYTKDVNGRWHGNPDDFVLELFPRLPR